MVKKSKIKTEAETRKQLLGWAQKFGAEAQLLKIFNRYDDLLKGAKTEEERKAIAAMGAMAVMVAVTSRCKRTGTGNSPICLRGSSRTIFRRISRR